MSKAMEELLERLRWLIEHRFEELAGLDLAVDIEEAHDAVTTLQADVERLTQRVGGWETVETAPKGEQEFLVVVDAYDRGTGDIVIGAHIALAVWRHGILEYAYTQRFEDDWRGKPIIGNVGYWMAVPAAPPLPQEEIET